MSEHETEQLAAGAEAVAGPEATEAARELAAANSVDLEHVRGTGQDGKITKADVEQHLSGGASTMPAAYDPPSIGDEGPKVWEGADE